MKHILTLAFACLLLWSGKCQQNNQMGAFQDVIGKEWMHSYEENVGESKAYRESSYKFPPSRGRIGFQMMADGTFYDLRIAPTDGIQKLQGKWTLQADGKSVKAVVNGEAFVLAFVRLQDGLLLLNRTSVSP